MNPKDVALAVQARGSDEHVTRIAPASHPDKIGSRTDPSFRRRFGVDGEYILWIGAWLRAKGVRLLSRRFAAFRARHPDVPIKLVMFGGYGEQHAGAELPEPHPDIVCVSHNTADVPTALSQCAFLAFNAQPHPVGYDANPLVLIEAMMNGKTFVAQSGTPLLAEISHLGRVVESDDEWLRAVERLLLDTRYRAWLEARCLAAYEHKYNLESMIDGFEQALLKQLMSRGSAVRPDRRGRTV